VNYPFCDGTGSADSNEWTWQLHNAVTSLEALESVLTLTNSEREGVRASLAEGFPMAITPYYLSLCDPHDSNCPVRKQCVPRQDESFEVLGDMRDPLGEESHQIAPYLIQRYPDRALLLVTDRCSVYCRFCTRSRLVGRGTGVRSMASLAAAFETIESNPQIQEIIVSGGDPLVMPTEHLATIIERLVAIPTVLSIRVATRVLATMPQRITRDLCQAMRTRKAIWLMTHFNHPKELTELSRNAAQLVSDHGIPIMNQTVLLRGINDDAATLEALFRALVRSRIRPYYLFQTDPVKGSGHFRTSMSAGLEIMERLQGRLSGIALPKFIVDAPGGKGKVPVGPDYIERVHSYASSRVTTLRTFRGERIDYVDPPDVSPKKDKTLRQSSFATDQAAVVAERRCPHTSFTSPPALRPEDAIALVAPAGPFDLNAFERGVARLQKRYRVLYDPGIVERKGYLAGDDDRRFIELINALENREVKAILTVRGGYGATRLLDRLDPAMISRHPKPLIGFSDITALHAAWARAGVRSIHGANLNGLADLDEQLFDRWISIVEGATPQTKTGLSKITKGIGAGPLVGGNLSVLCALVGTPYVPPLSGCVLFLEDIREAPYRVDRLLTTLYQAGWLNRVSAIILGAFEKAEADPSAGTIQETLQDRLGRLDIPVVSGFPSGHISDNQELPFGSLVSVNADDGVVEFNEPATTAQ
jgi:lysine 2,3-aminomutase